MCTSNVVLEQDTCLTYIPHFDAIYAAQLYAFTEYGVNGLGGGWEMPPKEHRGSC